MFALFCVWLIAVLVGRGASGPLTAGALVLFLLHPATAWNARCMRPELTALFFLLGGIALMTEPDRRAGGLIRGLMSGGAVALALLFHVTSAYVLLPALLLAAWRFRPIRFWYGWCAGMLAGLCVFCLQTVLITDPYWLIPSFTAVGRRPFWLVAGAGLLLTLTIVFRHGMLGRCLVASLRRDGRPTPPRRESGGWAMSLWKGEFAAERLCGLLAALLFVAGVIWIWGMRDAAGNVPGLPLWMTPYLSLTDFRGVVCVSSRLWSLAALAGVFCLCVSGGMRGARGRQLFVLFGPGAVLSGWMSIYMFETRRMMIALVPLMVFAIVALIQASENGLRYGLKRLPCKPGRTHRGDAVLPILWMSITLLLFGVAAVRGRDALYTLQNRAGTFRFFEAFSKCLQPQGDFLFAEYTQTAAPVEAFTGMPLLPIAWGYRSDREYRLAESVMASVVRANPDRRHLLITPFASAALPGVAQEPLFSGHLKTRLLERIGRRSIPRSVLDNELNLQVYRLHPRGLPGGGRPYVRLMDGSGLGIAGRSNYMPARSIKDKGMRLSPDQLVAMRVSLPPGTTNRLVMIFSVTAPAPDRHVTLTSQGRVLPVTQSPMIPGWDMLEVDSLPSATGWQDVQLQSASRMFLTDVFVLGADGPQRVPWKGADALESFPLGPINAQWLRADAGLALPAPEARRSLFVYASAGRRDGVQSILSVKESDSEAGMRGVSLPEGWAWSAIAQDVGQVQPRVFAWYDFSVEPAWNPNLPSFPDDLGLLLHAVVTMAPAD